LIPSTLITLIWPVLPALAIAREAPRPMSSFATKKPFRFGRARSTSVAAVRAVCRSQLAATVWTIVSFEPTPSVKPSTRAPLVTSPAMPPMAATSPPPGISSTMRSPAILPASTLSVPM
jgi:hypothetical protein